MRYQFVPGHNSSLVAAGNSHDLIVSFDGTLWRGRIASFGSDDSSPAVVAEPWSAATPDLTHLLTTGMAVLRTLDTDGVR